MHATVIPDILLISNVIVQGMPHKCDLLLLFSDHPFLPYLEVLLTNQRAEEHHPLLSWCVQYLRTVDAQMNGQAVMNVDSSPLNNDIGEDVEDGEECESVEMSDAEREAQERREKGLEKRAQLMSNISVMQKRFLIEHKEELDQIDAGHGSG